MNLSPEPEMIKERPSKRKKEGREWVIDCNACGDREEEKLK